MTTSRSQIPEKRLLNAITTVLSHFITETDPYVLFNGLLTTLLDITDSEYGFIGEVFYAQDDTPFIKSYATTNISWSEETRRLYDETKRKGMIFSRLDSLYGAVLKTGQLVISNQPTTDPRSCGLPQGHPSLNAFMGMPFYGGGELLGVVGVANRRNGYQRELADSLSPFLMTCGNLIQAYRNNLRHQQVELELNKYKERLAILVDDVALGFGYSFSPSPPALMREGHAVVLTRKELSLLALLVLNRNHPVQYATIQEHVWPDVIVGDSSLRSLVRRLRKKLPELTLQNVSGVGYMLVVG